MKHVLLLLIFVSASLAFTGTRTWVILNPETVEHVTPYEDALAKADLDKYRYFDKRNTLHFENGLNVELLSANELQAQGIAVKTDRVRTEEPAFDTKPVFRLSPDGILIEVQTRSKVK
ncbi:MAG TPA: hypothetical protein VK826_04650 [Bacteroidia bacterium]|nr:hypothetical protein [Bacteroidia bacterium]